LNGDFDLGQSTEVIFDLRLDGDVASRTELGLADFVLPAESCRLFACIDLVANGVAEKITVHEGIPRRLLLRRSVQHEVI
jgi:hypothetical protein